MASRGCGAGGNVLVDPVPMSAHDEAHLRDLGGAATIVVTNSDHTRDAVALAEKFGAKILGPRGEQDGFPDPVRRLARPGRHGGPRASSCTR